MRARTYTDTPVGRFLRDEDERAVFHGDPVLTEQEQAALVYQQFDTVASEAEALDIVRAVQRG